jgi:hypothetical protein
MADERLTMYIERLAYSSIYVLERPSSSARRDFIDGVLNMGGSSEGGGIRGAVIELYVL